MLTIGDTVNFQGRHFTIVDFQNGRYCLMDDEGYTMWRAL